MVSAKTILIVEDSRSVRFQVRTVLAGAGYKTIEAENGEDGLKLIQQPTNNISLVIADINMPVKTGLEMIEEAREQMNRGLPVIMLTTEGRPEYIRRAKAAGAKGWFVKPFDSLKLIETIERLIPN